MRVVPMFKTTVLNCPYCDRPPKFYPNMTGEEALECPHDDCPAPEGFLGTSYGSMNDVIKIWNDMVRRELRHGSLES